ncbi:MAG: DUF1007 family protein [Xanthobacteraceae bacterium]|nr:MAG: DUF1007 family protein [Xanthobacteraceae bacterium]
MRRIFLGAMVLGAALMAAVPAAKAHPHVWVVSASEVIYGADGAVTGIRHAWTFDDMFSTYALQGLETKTKGVYSREELAPLAETNVTSLKEFGFFTFVRAGGRKEKFNEPVDYYLEYTDSRLVLHFTLPFKTPVQAKELALEVYDPSYFVGFDLAEKEPVRFVGAPAGCAAQVAAARDAKPPQQTLSEQNFMSGDTSNYGAMFANKITVTCP